MKILLVTASFHPEISPRSFRMTELCQQFCREGHEVTVVTNASEECQTMSRQLGFRLINLGKPSPAIGPGTNRVTNEIRRWLRRGLQLFFEYPDITWAWKVNRAIRKLNGYDLMISSAVPHPVHWGVAWTRGRSKRIAPVWVADCGDPFMMAYLDTFNHPFYFGPVEKFFCRRADFISVPSITFQSTFYPEFANKLVEIPQGVNPDDFPVFREQIPSTPIRFAYAGAFIPRVRDPSAFLDYLSRQTDRNFIFSIYTSTPKIPEAYQDRLGDKLQIQPLIPRREVVFELSKNHFLVNIGFDPKSTMPSKLIDYWLTGRPILSLPLYNQIHEDEIAAFLSGDYSKAFVIDNPERFRIDQVTKKFLSLVN